MSKNTLQHAKKVVSDSLGLVDFAIGLVIFVFNLPNGQVLTLLAEAFPLCFSALYCHSLRGFGCSRFVLVVSVPRKRPLQTAVWDSC